MWQYTIQKLKKKKFIIIYSSIFIFFMLMYGVLDYFNGGYKQLYEVYGLYLVILNIFLNIIMALISGFMLTTSTIYYKESGKEGKGTALTGISYLFGILTYGCTPCVIAFFGTIGITFSVIALPLAGFPYKLISLGILILGLFWLKHEITHAKCAIRKDTSL